MSSLRESHPIRDSACVPDNVRLALPALRTRERALYADVPMYSCSGMTITCPICAVASDVEWFDLSAEDKICPHCGVVICDECGGKGTTRSGPQWSSRPRPKIICPACDGRGIRRVTR